MREIQKLTDSRFSTVSNSEYNSKSRLKHENQNLYSKEAGLDLQMIKERIRSREHGNYSNLQKKNGLLNSTDNLRSNSRVRSSMMVKRSQASMLKKNLNHLKKLQ